MRRGLACSGSGAIGHGFRVGLLETPPPSPPLRRRFQRPEALEAAQKLLFRHRRRRPYPSSGSSRPRSTGRFSWATSAPPRLSFIDLGTTLHRVNEPFPRVARRNRLASNLAQSNDAVLVVFRIDGDGRPFRDRSRPVYRQQYQLEPVCHLIDAVFDGYTCHALVPTSNRAVLTTKVRTTPTLS